VGEIRTAVEMREHQQKALRELHDGAILWGGVGSGKSRVGMAYYVLTEEHENLYVITTAKKRDSLDWETEAARFGVGKEPDATFAGVLAVDSWNNIEKYIDVKNAFFIFDEQRLVGAGPWTKAFLKIARNNRWIMLSATPGDTWLDYIPVFVANGFYKNRTEFKHEHVIYAPFAKYPKVDRYVNVQRLIRQRNKILIRMPFERETVRHPNNVWCEYDLEKMARVEKDLWNPYKEEPIRDVAEKFHVMRRVVNEDPTRLKAVKELLEQHPRLIIFYNFNYELEILRGLQASMPYAEWNGKKHEEIPETDKWVYVVQYAAGAEGWNCTKTNAVCFYSLTYSYKLWEQSHGRIDRMDTEYTDLHYYTLRSKAAIDWAVWRSIKAKRNFQPSHYGMGEDKFLAVRLGEEDDAADTPLGRG
jgi:hypothetical protein